MWDFLWWLIAGAVAGTAAAVTVAVICSYWDSLRETIKSWLHQNNLHTGWLMRAFVHVDRYLGRLRSRFFAQSHDQQCYTVEERAVTEEEMRNHPELQEAVNRYGVAEFNVQIH